MLWSWLYNCISSHLNITQRPFANSLSCDSGMSVDAVSMILITEGDTARPPPGWSQASVNKHIQLLFYSNVQIARALGV